jgi:tetratricopeptide (TPR) repeat protein
MVDVSPELAGQVSARLAGFARLYPRNASALYYYALSLRKRGSGEAPPADDRAARALFERAVKLEPGFADAHFELGLLHEDHREDRQAIQEYEAAIRMNPALSKAHYHLGKLYQKAGYSTLARQEFQRFEAAKQLAASTPDTPGSSARYTLNSHSGHE